MPKNKQPPNYMPERVNDQLASYGGDFAARQLDTPITFLIEVGKDGFNFYRRVAAVNAEYEIFAASSAVSTFAKAATQILNCHIEGEPMLVLKIIPRDEDQEAAQHA
jgi:hypothetical protein